MSRQQLESTFATPSAPKATLKAKLKPKSTSKPKKRSTSKAEAKGKSKPEPKSTIPVPILNLDEFGEREKNGDSEKQIIIKKYLHEWYDWLFIHISNSVKKSASDVKEKIINLFLKDYKTKKNCRRL